MGRIFGNLDISNVTDSRVFWKIIKPNISDKVKISSKITLLKIIKSCPKMLKLPKHC